ncbi:MAG: right-handed parallel beta-helix repeat-containing protein [Candidatus Nitrosotenuis sp.]
MKKLLLVLPAVLIYLYVPSAFATTDCQFTTTGTTMALENDCTADETILVPDGFTLDGQQHTITAVDPAGGHFVGAVVKNQGATAYVKNINIATSGLANVCDGGNDRLRGIMFEGASGSILHNTILGLNQAGSGCQEGNAIEVRNAPFDGTHPNTMVVEVGHNTISDYQKTGIVANGDVSVDIHHNKISSTATPQLAANSVQLGFGASGTVQYNQIDGNQWCGSSDFAATAILVFDADNVSILKNHIGGNSDIGIYGFGDNLTIDGNKVFDSTAIADCNQFGYDIGVGNYGENNSITKNQVGGFETPFDGDVGAKNKVKKPRSMSWFD